ncbi:NUDIX domain-containing protein [Paenibacillus sp. MWE-103]|uniref:NUDIX domain-containing protein n=1 Tax=Paenibacillus artemisiicola TaxID=1172618 RepID=A0ABS3W412_9BACL|nr:NUDIX domain-containing protein [Paenibacillus artemisiicola]MBO7743046.1 NUDIX domain-containing protein [Paenibacillus artemisiicola]
MAPKHIVSAATIVLNGHGEILLIKGPKRGWEMPGGQVEEGESARDAAIRETREESGIEIEVTRFCGVFQNVSACICNLLFLGKPVGGTLTTTPESLEVGYYPIETALRMVEWGNFKQRIELCLNEALQPFFIEFSIPLRDC